MRVGKPPQFLFDGAVKRKKWTARARLVLLAFQMYEDSLCGTCRQSGFHALDVANTRRYTIDSVTCLGCNVKEVYAENTKDNTHVKGEKVFVKNTMGVGPPDED